MKITWELRESVTLSERSAHKRSPDDCILLPALVIPVRVGNIIVQPATLFAVPGTFYNQFCHGSYISQLNKVGRHPKVPVIPLDFFLNYAQHL